MMESFDTSVIDALEKKKKEQVDSGKEIDPHELPEMDVRIRDGTKHDDDVMIIDDVEVSIPQLTIMDLRRIQVRSLQVLEGTELASKITDATRIKKDPNDEIELSFSEKLILSEVGIEEDFWLVWFALKKSSHPKFTGNIVSDREWIGTLPNFDVIVKKIRYVNAMDEKGEQRIKFFRN